MEIRKVARKRIRHQSEGADLTADVNAVIAAQIGSSSSMSIALSRQRIVQSSEWRGRSRDNRKEEGSMTEPDEAKEVESEGSRPASPIDEDFDGELNAALPDEPDDTEDDS